jgi:hypothetical protein
MNLHDLLLVVVLTFSFYMLWGPAGLVELRELV